MTNSMTSRERVLTAFSHREPDRVPFWCGASVEFWDKLKCVLGLEDEELRVRLGDDFRRVQGIYVGPSIPLSDAKATSRTVFGIEREGFGYGQPLSHPLQKASVAEVHAYPWPNPDWIDVSHIHEQARSWDGQYAILGGDWSPFWHDLIDLVGMEELYMRMYDEPEFVDAVLFHLVEYYYEVSRRIFESAADVIDIFFIGNDLGSQTGPLLGPVLFERFILPHLSQLIKLGHKYGLKVQMHCCGGFEPLIPMLIKSELDAIHAVQSSCLGMELQYLKSAYGDQIVFNGAIDSHHVLIDGTPESVREDTRMVLDVMKPGGGFIAGASHDTILEETPIENVLAMSDAIKEYGHYSHHQHRKS